MPAPRSPAWPLLAAGLAIGLLPQELFVGPSPSRSLNSLRSHRQGWPIALKALDGGEVDALEFLESIPAELEGRDKRVHVGKALKALKGARKDLARRCLDQLRPGDVELAPVLVGLMQKPATSSIPALFSVLDTNVTVGMQCMLEAKVQQEDFTGDQRYYLQIVVGELAKQEQWHLVYEVVMKWGWLVPDILGEVDAAIVALKKQEEWALVGRLAKALGRRELANECFSKSRDDTIRKSIKSGKPMTGIHVAERTKAGKKLFIHLLLNEGMTDLAKELSQRWAHPFVMTHAMTVKEGQRKTRHYQLEKKLESELHMVTTEARVRSIAPNLLEAPAVGMDIECGQGNKPVLMQLATLDTVYLFDLLKLKDSEALASLLAELMESEQTTFLTFGGAGDLASLAKLGGFKDVMGGSRNNCVELQEGPEQIGLSTLAEETLGAPVDKSMTASDWRKRPLSMAQKRYAALDAWILLKIYQVQQRGRPSQWKPPLDENIQRGQHFREWYNARAGR